MWALYSPIDMGASVHSAVNGVAFLAFRVCSLVASKCLVVLPHCSCETYGLFFCFVLFSPLLISFFMAGVLTFGKKHTQRGQWGCFVIMGKQ